MSSVVLATACSTLFVTTALGQDVEELKKKLQTIERLASNPKPSESVEQDLAKNIAGLVRAFPDEPAVMFWVADHTERQGKFDDAAAIWKRLLPLKSRLPEPEVKAFKARACARVSQSLLGKLDGEGAEAFAKQCMELDPSNPMGPSCLLESALRTGKLSATLETLKGAAANVGAKAPGVRVVYHDALARFGEWNRLKEEVERLPSDDRRPEDYHHFRARLAEVDGRALDAFLFHYLAAVGGEESASTTRASQGYVDKTRYREEKDLPAPLSPYVKAINLLDRADSNPDKRTAGIRLPTSDIEPARQAGRYLESRCAAAANEPGVEAKWRDLVRDYPNFAPNLVGLAEAIEVENGESNEIAKLLSKAESLSPTNFLVRLHTRMGVRWRPTKEGAVALAVVPDTSWGRFKLQAGDELLELDDKKLSELPVHQRMSYVRQFVGGRVVYRPKNFTNTIERELELIFFD